MHVTLSQRVYNIAVIVTLSVVALNNQRISFILFIAFFFF